MALNRPTRGKLAAALIGIGLVATAFTIASPSQASFPGINGLIAYVQGGNVFVVDASNPFPTQVTNTGNFVRAKYNATGSKLVADQVAGLVLLDPVQGSAVTPIPNTTGVDTRPAFDPTGTKVAFTNAAGAGLATIDTNGSNRTNVTGTTNAGRPDWSPDGTFIAFDLNNGTAIKRVGPNGGGLTTLATTGPAGACGGLLACFTPSVKPDNVKVAYGQRGAAGGVAEVNANGTTVTPSRLTTGGKDVVSYSPDGLQIVSILAGGPASRAPTDGSGTQTPIPGIPAATWVNWGVSTGGTGTGTGTGVTPSVINVNATRTGKTCSFTIAATPAAAGITVDFSVTTKKGVQKDSGNDVPVPSTVTSTSKKVRIITLSDPKGATLGTASATCAKKVTP